MEKKKRAAKGSGYFKENPNGTVTYSKSFGFLPSGARRVFTVTASSRAECIKRMRERELRWEKEKKAQSIDKTTTVRSLCLHHLEYQIRNKELTSKSIDRRETTIERHIGDYALGYMQAYNCTSSDIEDHMSELIAEDRLSASSIKKVIDVLNAAYSWAVDRGEMPGNPVSPIKNLIARRIAKLEEKSENEADVFVLSNAEKEIFEEFVLSLKTSNKRMFLPGLYGLFLLKTGLRGGELCALRWGDYDETTGILTVNKSRVITKDRSSQNAGYTQMEKETKNQKARKIELFDDAKTVLEQIKENSAWTNKGDYIAATKTGKPNTDTNLEHRMRSIFRESGIFVGENETGSLHIFRRTFATDLYYNKNVPLKTIAAYLGDRPETVQRYYIAAREKVVSADGEVQQVVMVKKYEK